METGTETVTAEALLADKPATTPTEGTAPAVTASELLDPPKPQEPEPDKPAATTADVVGSPTPDQQAQPAPTLDSEPGQRKLMDYEKLDWSKSNAQLARELGVTRQYIGQVRAKLQKARENNNKPDFSDIQIPPEQQQLPAATNYDAMANVIFDMSAGTLSMVFGPEWQPRSPEEKQTVVIPLKAYLETQQVKDLPPGVVLAFVCLGYCAPRFTAPQTKAKLSLGWQWCKVKLGKIFRRKPKQQPLMVLPKADNASNGN